jgi:hypothetical protein
MAPAERTGPPHPESAAASAFVLAGMKSHQERLEHAAPVKDFLCEGRARPWTEATLGTPPTASRQSTGAISGCDSASATMRSIESEVRRLSAQKSQKYFASLAIIATAAFQLPRSGRIIASSIRTMGTRSPRALLITSGVSSRLALSNRT